MEFNPSDNAYTTGYFIASQDGQHFNHVPQDAIKELLTRQYIVYYVDYGVPLTTVETQGDRNEADRQLPTVLTEPSSSVVLLDSQSGQDAPGIAGESISTSQLIVQPSVELDGVLIPAYGALQADGMLPPVSDIPKTSTRSSARRTSVQRTCPVCNETFNTKKTYMCHLSKHEEGKPYKCPNCTQSFNYLTNLTIHLTLEKPGESPYKCPICEQLCSRFSAFKSHLLIHQLDDHLQCSLCQSLFTTQCLLDAHMRSEHQNSTKHDPVYRCHTCQETLPTNGQLRKHYQQYHPSQRKTTGRVSPVLYTDQSAEPEFCSRPEAPQQEDSARRSKTEARALLSCVLSQRRTKHDEAQGDKLIRLVDPDTTATPLEPVLLSKLRRKKSKCSRVVKRPMCKCPVCGKKFTHITRAKMHMLHHVSKKPFECLICHLRFAEKSSARAHVARHDRPVSNSICPICQRIFCRPSALVNHLKHHHKEYSFEVLNPDQWTTEWVLQESQPHSGHVVQPLSSTSLHGFQHTDPVPDYAHFPVDSTVIPLHLPMDVAVEVVELNDIPPPEGLPSNTLPHSQPFCSTRPFQCDVCKKSFACSRTLSVHMLRHPSVPLPFSCPACPLRFSTASRRRHHLRDHRLHTVTRVARRTTSHCGTGPLKWDRTAHRFVSIGRRRYRPFMCSDCPNSYKSKVHLDYHVRQRHDIQQAPHVCQVCSKRFVTEHRLRKHTDLAHSNVVKLSYVCLMCAASFSCRSSLKRHMVIHSGEKPYKCTVCHKLFKFDASCRRHMKSHLDDTQSSETSLLYSSTNQYGPYQSNSNMPTETGATTYHPETQHIVDLDQVFEQNTSSQLCPVTQTLCINQGHIELTSVDYSVDGDRNRPVDGNTQSVSITAGPLPMGHATDFHQHSTQFPCGDLRQDSVQGMVYSEQAVATYFHSDLDKSDPRNAQLNPLMTQYSDRHPTHLLVDNLDNLVPSTHYISSTHGYQKVHAADSSFEQVPQMPSRESDHIDEAGRFQYANTSGHDLSAKEKVQSMEAALKNRSNQPYSELNPCTSVQALLFGCGLCPASFGTSDQLRLHADTTHAIQPRPFQCDSCQLAFASETLLLAHKSTHVNPPQGESQTHRCPSCPAASFSNKSALTRHILACHPLPVPDPFRCTYCNVRFRLLSTLKAHISNLKDAHKSANQRNTSSKAVVDRHNRTRAKRAKSNNSMVLKNRDARISEQTPERTMPNKSLTMAVCKPSIGDLETVPLLSTKVVTNSKKSTKSVCPICNWEFKLASDLKRHMCTHTCTRPFQCNECSSQFTKHCRLRKHIQRVHTSKCVTTNMVEPDTMSLQINQICPTGFVCHICDQNCSSADELRSHVRQHDRNLRWFCSHCNIGFATPAERQLHILQCNRGSKSTFGTPDLPIELPDRNCQDSTVLCVPESSDPTFNRQSAEATQGNDSAVETENFSNNSETSKLRIVCFNEEPETADSCSSYVFAPDCSTVRAPNDTLVSVNVGDASEQILSQHSPQASSVEGVTQKTEEFFPNEYLNTTDGNDLFKRPDTTGHVTHKRSRNSQLVTGRRNRRLGKRCIKSSKSNTLQRLFRCSICHVEFTRRHSLIRHEHTHINYRPHVCTECKASFTQPYALTRHLRIHTLERPFKCNHCYTSFRKRSNLRQHLEKVHNEAT